MRRTRRTGRAWRTRRGWRSRRLPLLRPISAAPARTRPPPRHLRSGGSVGLTAATTKPSLPPSSPSPPSSVAPASNALPLLHRLRPPTSPLGDRAATHRGCCDDLAARGAGIMEAPRSSDAVAAAQMGWAGHLLLIRDGAEPFIIAGSSPREAPASIYGGVGGVRGVRVSLFGRREHRA